MQALADVSFGILAFMPMGWAFMVAIVLLECVIFCRYLAGSWWQGYVATSVTLANVVSGAVGIGLSIALNGGWWFIIWLPWVSKNEVAFPAQIIEFTIYYLVAFCLSIIIEGAIEYRMLRGLFPTGRIVRACLIANTASYLFGSVAMYSWSFH